MAVSTRLSNDSPGLLSTVSAPTAPAAATGYPGGSTLADAMAAAYAANPAAFAAPAYSFNVSSNKGNPTGQVSVSENTPIALVNNRTGELVYSGVGVDAAKKIETLAADLTKAGGNKATWSVYTAPAGATDSSQFTQVAYEKPNKSLGGTLLSVAAPVLGSILLPGVGGAIGGALTGALGSVGTSALGAALGSAALGTARGEGIGDILQNAALAGGTSYLGGTLFNQLGGASSATKAGQTGGLLSDVGPIATPLTSAEIARLTSDLALPLVSGAAGGVASTVGAPIVVTGSTAAPSVAANAIGAGASGLLPYVSPTGDVMVMTQQAQQPTNPADNMPVPDFSGVGPIATPLTPEQIANATNGGTGVPGVNIPGGTTTTPQPSTLDDILKYIGGATTIGGGLLDLIKGGSGATAGTATPYTSVLGPAPNLGRGALTPYTGDYEKYAFGPEWNFFGGQQPA